ncbi:MAG TPA: dienelactone hydrolase family protein [Capsulimonadaceae bacterium]
MRAQNSQPQWDQAVLRQTPATHEFTGSVPAGVKGLYYEGLPYAGRATWIFAYYAAPAGTPPKGGWPAVVLLHGGGGTAYAEWVRRWNAAGFAAIAMDLEGREPDAADTKLRKSTPQPGPTHSFGNAPGGVADQFPYRAVAQAALANSLLRSFPEINPAKIGLCGISWGSIWTCLTAGVDDRIAFAIPIYGHGFLNESDAAVRIGKDSPPALMIWDPSRYVPLSKMPLLFIASTNDRNFYPKPWQKTVDLRASGVRELLIPNLSHSHEGAWEVPEAYSYAREIVDRAATAADRVTSVSPGEARASSPPAKAELWYTTAAGPWEMRKWRFLPAIVVGATVKAPPAADFARITASYFLMTRPDGSRLSSPVMFNSAAEVVIVPPPSPADGIGTVLVSDDFESRNLGTINGQGSWKGGGGVADVEAVDGHGKALSMAFPFTAIDLPIPGAGTDTVFIRFSLKATPPASNGPKATQKLLVFAKDAAGKSLCLTWHDCTGLWGVQVSGGYSQRALKDSTGEWTRAELAIDQKNRKVTLRLTNNGTSVTHYSAVDYSSDDAGPLASVSFVRNKEGDVSKLWLDDVSVIAVK